MVFFMKNRLLLGINAGVFANLVATIVLILLCVLFGCSSIPDFRPSRPIEEASSLRDALGICGEYQIKGEQNASGAPELTRVVTLIPWLRCFEKSLQRIPEARNHESLVHFYRALQSRYEGAIAADRPVIDWPEMNFVVNASIEHFKNPNRPFTTEQRQAIGRQLPGFYMSMADSGDLTSGGKTNPNKKTGGTLHWTKGEIISKPVEPLPARPVSLSVAQRDYCKRYRAHQSLLFNIRELEDYQRILRDETFNDVSNTSESTSRTRIENRLKGLYDEADKEQRFLASEFLKLKSTSSWFLSGYCLESSSGHFRK
jgi:hypothetical protein